MITSRPGDMTCLGFFNSVAFGLGWRMRRARRKKESRLPR
jgi:hypothetical protein